MRKAAAKLAPAHPTWKEIVKECITTSDAPARQGVSCSAIKKERRLRAIPGISSVRGGSVTKARVNKASAKEKYNLSGPAHVSQLNRAIIAGVKAGIFDQPCFFEFEFEPPARPFPREESLGNCARILILKHPIGVKGDVLVVLPAVLLQKSALVFIGDGEHEVIRGEGSFDHAGCETSGSLASAIYALSKIAGWPDGAQAALDAGTLDHVTQFLGSPHANVRKWTCNTVGNLSAQRSTIVAVLAIKPCPKLVDLLRKVLNLRASTMQLTFEQRRRS
ncbi:hypothetical protein B0H16DRAFT_1469059 [Mycena metata]|uniref:Uncharacterized protein n=1 Tax=Mycena metata TaxID=1033252 RepID=A0AAD7HZ74_9AGAR|nr:hypothetical protein B0H16DRAFT_1469059 [Mycena metata]